MFMLLAISVDTHTVHTDQQNVLAPILQRKLQGMEDITSHDAEIKQQAGTAAYIDWSL